MLELFGIVFGVIFGLTLSALIRLSIRRRTAATTRNERW